MKKLVWILVVLAAWPVSGLLADDEMANIVTHHGRPADCLAPIAINKVDGEQTLVPAMGFAIEPGVHTVNGRAALDTTFCSVGRGGNRGWYAPDLEVNFEAGKTYYIGYDHSSKNRDEWTLVVWKVE